MAKMRLMREFYSYLSQNKKLFLIPVVVILLLFGLIILVGQSQALAPFIYSLF